MTPQQLARATGARIDRATAFIDYIEWAMIEFEINTPERQAAFIAQIGHESGGLKYTTELWGPTPAQIRYEGRKDLGNVRPGDGSLFRGHGLIQTTGRHNHARVRDRLRARFPGRDVPDFEAEPHRLAEPEWAALSAADYWDEKDLNRLADVGDFHRITLRINGGTNGMEDRLARHAVATEALA